MSGVAGAVCRQQWGDFAERREGGIEVWHSKRMGLLKKTRLKTPDFKNIVLYEISRLSCTFEMFSFQVFAFLFP